MKPAYYNLKRHHYSSDAGSASYVPAEKLYDEVGYDYEVLLKENPGYQNTCAVRMSLALLKAGVPFMGRLQVKAGDFKGKHFEPGAKLLADQLAKPAGLGRPSVLQRQAARQFLSGKKGVVLFWKIDGYGGGHIDLIEAMNNPYLCNSNCFFESREVWFWSLP